MKSKTTYKILKNGQLPEVDTQWFIQAVAQQADSVIVATDVPGVSHWWLLRGKDHFSRIAYFGTPESYEQWLGSRPVVPR